MWSDPNEDADGPAVKCPGRPPEQPCEDYPAGSCTRCIAVADGELPIPKEK